MGTWWGGSRCLYTNSDDTKCKYLNLFLFFKLVFVKIIYLLQECVKRFPVLVCGSDGQQKQEKYSLTSPTDNIKCNIVVCGDIITFGEISFKIQRHQNVTYRTTITHDNPWKLQQVQDARNHLQQALRHVNNIDKGYTFTSSEEVLHILGKVLGALQRGRSSLIVPRKRTMDELMKSRNMVRYFIFKLNQHLQFTFNYTFVFRKCWFPIFQRTWQ